MEKKKIETLFEMRRAGGLARAKKLSKETRKMIAANAAKARWDKHNKENK